MRSALLQPTAAAALASAPLSPLSPSTLLTPSTPLPPHSSETLNLLDDPEEWAAFSRRVADVEEGWESNLVIEGMHCAACSITVEDAIAAVPGVLRVQVSAATQRAKVLWCAAQVRPSAWMQAVQQHGYRAIPANDAFASERRRLETRKALWRWLVAALCMMQVMMYAYPAYSAQPGDLSSEMEQLLRWASWVLSLPVLLFSCGPFFSNALRDLRHLRVSMDLPVALGIAITFGVSSLGTFDPAGPFGREVYFDSLTMFVTFLLTGRWLELRLRNRTAGALEALLNRLPESLERSNAAGVFERVAIRRLRIGDLLRVHPGQAFAADGVVELGQTLVDEALLTGESHPLPRGPGARVVAGSHNLSSTVQVRVQALGPDTRFGQIVALMQSAATTKPQSALLADLLAKPFLLAVLLAAALACLWWWPTDPARALMVAVAVLVVTCPCALSLATPAAMLVAAGNLARQGVLVRNLQALEALSQVDVVVFDKTGTLTQDQLEVSAVAVRAGTTAAEAVQMGAALAAHSLHPASKALRRAAGLAPYQSAVWCCEAISEQAGQGVSGRVYRVRSSAAGSRAMRLGSAAFCAVEAEASETSTVYLSDEQGWLARFEIREALRPDAAAAVAALQQAGLQVHLLSGDASGAVRRIAAQLDIANVKVIARGGCSPADKLSALHAMQAQGNRVLMVGDGMNDAPVLAGAQVSMAFGKAVPLAQAQADLVLPGERLMVVPHTLLLARQTMCVVRQNLGWALLYNAACVPLAIAGYLPAWLAGLGMASSSLLVVANAVRLTRFHTLPKGR